MSWACPVRQRTDAHVRWLQVGRATPTKKAANEPLPLQGKSGSQGFYLGRSPSLLDFLRSQRPKKKTTAWLP